MDGGHDNGLVWFKKLCRRIISHDIGISPISIFYCVADVVCPALSAPGSCGQAVALMSHDTSQSSREPHRVHKHPSPVTMIDWKRILSEVPISHSTETFAYFVHFLCVFWRRNFFRGYVTGQKSLRGMILVTNIMTITRARSSSAVTRPGARSGPLPPLGVSPSILMRWHSEEERDDYISLGKH